MFSGFVEGWVVGCDVALFVETVRADGVVRELQRDGTEEPDLSDISVFYGILS